MQSSSSPDHSPSPFSPQPSQNQEQRPQSKPPEGWRSALSTVFILVSALVIAVLLMSFVFQSYEVDGPSMESTLSDGDRLIVWKVPRTIARITNNPYIPDRGDIVVFYKQGVYGQGRPENRQLIKRVIGLPGDRVTINAGRVTIYNSQFPGGFNPDTAGEYEISIPTSGSNDIDITVPENELFLAGDNRVNSHDSRSFGTVPADNIVGKLSFRMTPLNKAQRF